MNQAESSKTEEATENVSSRVKSQKAISEIVISALMLSLAVAIEFIMAQFPFFKWPYGGTVSLTMLPLCLVALYCGPIYGTVIGVAFGAINFFIDGVISWTNNVLAVALSLILDYLVGFGASGLASIFRKPFYEKKAWAPFAGITLACVVRFISSFFSGMIVFTTAFDYDSTSGLAMDWSWGGFTYSFTYNIGYMLPSLVLCLIVMAFLIKAIYTTFSYNVIKPLIPSSVTETSTVSSKVSFETLMPLYLAIDYALSIISAIVPMYLSWFGYISLGISIGLVAYEIVRIVRTKKETGNLNMPSVLYLSLSLVCVGVSLMGILSPFTYGKARYDAQFAPKEESSLHTWIADQTF